MTHRDDWLDEQPTMITVREVVYDPLEAPTLNDMPLPTHRRRRQWVAWGFIALTFVGVIAACVFAFSTLYASLSGDTVYVIVSDETTATNGALSPVFTEEVQFWSEDIMAWSEDYGLDPNLIATVIQIESCGDPTAGSSAGAQGLFQVMPFHFEAGESMLDVDTNARRGLNYLSQSLEIANGHPGLALAGYNGGHGVIGWGWARWHQETRKYYYWGVGIYQDAIAGRASSERLDEWLSAGGRSLCNQAATVQRSLAASP